MISTWLKLAASVFGGPKSEEGPRRSSTRLALEGLEGREVMSANIGQGVIPQAIMVQGSNLVFDDPNWSQAPTTLYGYLNTSTPRTNGGTFKEWSSSTNTLYDYKPNGNVVQVGTNVQDFTIDKNGILWVLRTNGALWEQTGTLTGSFGGMTRVDTGVSFLSENFGGNGDVWGVTSTGALADYSSGWVYTFSNPVTDFAFQTTGNLIAFTAPNGGVSGGSVLSFNVSNVTYSVLMTNAILVDDWRANPLFGYDYFNPAAPATSGKDFGNQFHGIDVCVA